MEDLCNVIRVSLGSCHFVELRDGLADEARQDLDALTVERAMHHLQGRKQREEVIAVPLWNSGAPQVELD
eukprot:2458825-Pyramimonas_sp.AAC.1